MMGIHHHLAWLTWCANLFGIFLAILLHPKGFSNESIVQNEYPNELDDPQVFDGLKYFQMKAWTSYIQK